MYTKNLVCTCTDRQGAVGSKGQRVDLERRTRESRAVPAPDANAELVLSMRVSVDMLLPEIAHPFRLDTIIHFLKYSLLFNFYVTHFFFF